MKILDVEQGSQAWLDAKLGIPSASNAHRIITPGMKRSGGQQKYLLQLLAEWVSGRTNDQAVSEKVLRGSDQEARAAAYYECETDRKLEKVGFVLRDDGLVGCSPDRLVIGEPGLVELKVPVLETHLAYLLHADPDEHIPQMQWQLWVTERQWVDLTSYNATQPSTILRYGRDEEFIKALAGETDRFVEALLRAKERLTAMGVVQLGGERKIDLTAAFAGVLG